MIMQPGPAQFFAQAPWIGWLGGDLGSLLFAAIASASAAVGVVWVILRRFGVLGAAAAALIVIAVEAQLGAGALVDVISSTHGQLPVLFAVLICAMVVTGDLRLFPLAVAVSSYVLQLHLSLVGYGLLVIPLLVAALVVGLRPQRPGPARGAQPRRTGLACKQPRGAQQVGGVAADGKLLGRNHERLDLAEACQLPGVLHERHQQAGVIRLGEAQGIAGDDDGQFHAGVHADVFGLDRPASLHQGGKFVGQALAFSHGAGPGGHARGHVVGPGLKISPVG